MTQAECVDCGSIFERGRGRSERCLECRIKHRRQYLAHYQRAFRQTDLGRRIQKQYNRSEKGHRRAAKYDQKRYCPDRLSAFAARLRQLRIEAGVSVTELAGRTKIARTYIHNLEAGLRGPTLQTAARLARALGVSLSEFDDIA